jgi:ubiquinone/menaquinone biosynthesis C-methylase UbiE
MVKREGKLGFWLSTAFFSLRNKFNPPAKMVREADIEPGMRVLDFGCGVGGHAFAAAELVGDTGRVYALDINALAVDRIERVARKKGFANVEAICSECETGLDGGYLDVAMIYDTFHVLDEPGRVLTEIHRVLKPAGVLSFSDHHMNEDGTIAGVTGGGFFRLSGKGEKTYTFVKAGR